MTLGREQSPQSSMGRALKGSGVANKDLISERTLAASRDAKDNRERNALGPELPVPPTPPQAKGPGAEQIRSGDVLRATSSPTLLTFISSGNGDAPSSKQTMSKADRELSPSQAIQASNGNGEHLENTELPGLFILNSFFLDIFMVMPSQVVLSVHDQKVYYFCFLYHDV